MEQELLIPQISSLLDMGTNPRFHLATMIVSLEKQNPRKRSTTHDFYLMTNVVSKENLWYVPNKTLRYCIAHIIKGSAQSRFGRRNLKDCMNAFNYHIVAGYPHYDVHSSPLFKTLLKLYGLEGR